MLTPVEPVRLCPQCGGVRRAAVFPLSRHTRNQQRLPHGRNSSLQQQALVAGSMYPAINKGRVQSPHVVIINYCRLLANYPQVSNHSIAFQQLLTHKQDKTSVKCATLDPTKDHASRWLCQGSLPSGHTFHFCSSQQHKPVLLTLFHLFSCSHEHQA